RLYNSQIECNRAWVRGDNLIDHCVPERDTFFSSAEPNGAVDALHSNCRIQSDISFSVYNWLADEGGDAYHRHVFLSGHEHDSRYYVDTANEVRTGESARLQRLACILQRSGAPDVAANDRRGCTECRDGLGDDHRD